MMCFPLTLAEAYINKIIAINLIDIILKRKGRLCGNYKFEHGHQDVHSESHGSITTILAAVLTSNMLR